jgi:hypothetical protein
VNDARLRSGALAEFVSLLKVFTRREIIVWSKFESDFGSVLRDKHEAFNKSGAGSAAEGTRRWTEVMRLRVTEHTLRMYVCSLLWLLLW